MEWLAGLAIIGSFLIAPTVVVLAIWGGIRLRRRAMRRGQYPLRLLPWYLGGPPEIEIRGPHSSPQPRKPRKPPSSR